MRAVTVVAALLLAFAGAVPIEVAAEVAGVTPLPPVEEVDGFAGTCFAHYYESGNRPFLPLARNAGSRHDRVDFRWDLIRAYGYGGYDDLVDDNLAAGIDLVAILWATPAEFRKPGCVAAGALGSLQARPLSRPAGWYAAELGSASVLAPEMVDPGACPPAGLYNTWSPGSFNGNRWAEFVYNTVTYFKGRVDVWEIWNEVEWGFFWAGTEAEYAQLLKVAYRAVKLADPEATVLFAGLHYWADPTYFERVLDVLNDDPQSPANNYFFDVMSVHLYSRSSSITDITQHIRQRMGLYVPDHPIWLTETGVPVYDGPYRGARTEYSAREVEAASYLIQSYANALAAGIERYHWFRVHDDSDSMGSEHFGLTHDEHYLRPAYVAYQVAATYLLSPTLVTHWTYASGARRVTLWGTPHGKVSILWSTLPQTVTFGYPATLPVATLVDQRGASRLVAALDETYTLDLPPATASRVADPNDFFIGGEPYLVVEDDGVPPNVEMAGPASATTYSNTIAVAWSGSDNLSGIWGYDVQVQTGQAGPWAGWLYFTQTGPTTSALYRDAVHGETYCFRVRAWDRVGHRSAWSEPPRCTTVDLTRQVRLDLASVVGEAPAAGVHSGDVVTLTNVSLRFVDENFVDVVPPVVGDSWQFTATLPAGAYYLIAVPEGWWSPPPGWLPRWQSVAVEPGLTVFELSYPQFELKAHRYSLRLTVVRRNG